MELKTITIDGIACQMTDTASVLVQKLQDEFDLFKKKKKKDDEDDEEEKNKFKKKDAAQDAAIAVKDKEISDVSQLDAGDIVRGFVKNVSDKGLFVLLGGQVTALVKISNLSDRYLKKSLTRL